MREYRKFCRPKTTKFPQVGDVEIKLNCGSIVYVKYKEYLKNQKVFKINSFVGESSNSSGNILVTDKETGKKAIFSIQDYSSIDNQFEIVSIIGNKKDPLEVRSYVDNNQGNAQEGDIILHSSELNIDAVFSYNDWLELEDSWNLVGLQGITTYEEEDAVNGDYVIMANGHTLIIKAADYSKVSSHWEHVDTIANSGPTAVDLGLTSGTLWADRNLEAETPEGSGLYYIYGDPEGFIASDAKASITMDENIPSEWNYTDVATSVLGSGWATPSAADFEELQEECEWEWTTRNGVSGILITSKASGNNNSIFLPAAGYIQEAQLQGVNVYGTYRNSEGYTAALSNGAISLQSPFPGNYGVSIRAVKK